MWLNKTFLDTTQKEQATREEKDKVDLIKIKSFCAAKDTPKKIKTQGSETQILPRKLKHKAQIFSSHI